MFQAKKEGRPVAVKILKNIEKRKQIQDFEREVDMLRLVASYSVTICFSVELLLSLQCGWCSNGHQFINQARDPKGSASCGTKIGTDLCSYAIGERTLHLCAFRRYVSGLFVLLLGNNTVFPDLPRSTTF